MKNLPIGVFDSGIGGLTVVKEIIRLLPHESIIYLGDTARVPYGTRGERVITEFALELANYLLTLEVKLLVVACNTISATCLEEIKNISPVPVLGVIEPAVKKIVSTSRGGQVGIIGTLATINSKVYENEIKKLAPSFSVQTKACPLFVPIVEEGLENSDIAKHTAKHYLSELKGIDTLHLGCTHYPLLRDIIQETVGSKVTIVDSALPTAKELQKVLAKKELLNDETQQPNNKFYVTDFTNRISTITETFLGTHIKTRMQQVDLYKLSL